MMTESLRQRWIAAMSKIALGLVDGERLTGEAGVTLARSFIVNAPNRPAEKVVILLEAEAVIYELAPNQEIPIQEESKVRLRRGNPHPGHYKKVTDKLDTIKEIAPDGIRKAARETGVAVNTVRKILREDNFPKPWCRVMNAEGVLVRYEDTDGHPIPNDLWPLSH